ncbi:MAG: 1-phosphofructokinase family hexose kinase, partial [Clostridiaceae bacterium]|nr:1-phosphofructokinase family hexose kinase [Clostridiaceae bacterium]
MITTIVLNPAVDKIYFVDNFEAGGLYRIDDTLISAGGKGINVARVARILGESVAALGFKAGQTGTWLENQLLMLGVETDLIEVEGESRTNNNIIDRTRNTETEVLEVGPSIFPENLDRFIEIYERKLKTSDLVILSGGLPQRVSCDIYRTMIEIARPYGVKTILDASGEVLRLGMEARPYMIKPNLRELCTLVNRELKDIGDIA